MKKVSFPLCVAVLGLITAFSCSKNNSPAFPLTIQPKKADQWRKEGSLLKVTAIIDYSNGPTDTWKWTNYEYDNNFNLVKTTDSSQDLSKEGYLIDGKIARQGTIREYQYSNNVLLKLIYRDSLYPVTNFSYNAQGQLVSAINAKQRFFFAYSSNGDTVEDTVFYNNGIKDIVILNRYYFQNGNIVKSQQFDITPGSFRQTLNIDYLGYDQKNTPLKALPQTNIVRLFFTSEVEASRNNVLSFDYTDVLNGSQATRNYTYEYNSAGYPNKSTPSDGFSGSRYFYYTNP